MDNLSNKMAKGAAWMVGFKIVERSIGLVSTIILARLLEPGDFGLVAMATAFLGLLMLLTSFSFDVALIQKQNADRHLYDTAWTFNVIFGVLLALALVGAAIPMAQFYMVGGLRGLLVGDKGYIRPCLKQELAQQGIDLQTPLRKNMQDLRPKAFVSQLMASRRLVETVIGQLTGRFHIEKARARDTWHLSNRFIRKVLAHTMGCFLSKLPGNPALLFEALVEI